MISDEKYLNATKQLFKNMPIKKIIESTFTYSKSESLSYKLIPKNLFVHQFYAEHTEYTIDEIRAFYDYYFNGKNFFYKKNNKEIDAGIFTKIGNIANEFLVDINSKPRVSFDNLLRWNLITSQIGEELFTTSFYALHDIKLNQDRNNFFWEHIIETDNNVLNKMLDNGLAENHYHLKGSSCIFICNWISLMNSITDRRNEFNELGADKELLAKETLLNTDNDHISFYHITKIAYVIRIYLFLEYCFKDNKNEEFNKNFKDEIVTNINKQTLLTEFFLDRLIDKLQSYMHVIMLRSKSFSEASIEVLDYAILKSKFTFKNQDNEMSIFFGERYLMYNIFKNIFYNENMTDKDKNLFYIYCCIKTKFQSEIIQNKTSLGFTYFAKFQDRKSVFIKKDSIIEKCLYKLAINANIRTQKLSSLEARIAPCYNENEFHKEIKKIDSYATYDLIKSPYRYKPNSSEVGKFFYTIHLIKSPDNIKKVGNFPFREIPRNNEVRLASKTVAKALLKVRENGNIKTRNRIRGIDTCNFEIGTRPEVFAQFYRALKTHTVNNRASISNGFSINDNEFGVIGRTYHVGEDFTDLLDGLRAIDEVIYFLEFDNGDRLGHSLALGYDCRKWYTSKNNTVTLTKQDLLDNLCWVNEKLISYNITISVKLLKCIDKKIYDLVEELYKDCFELSQSADDKKTYINTDLYIKSIKLRGDNPKCYKFGKLNQNITDDYVWRTYQFKIGEELDEIRKDETVCQLYAFYHYNTKTIKNGNKKESYTYTDEFVEVISKIQKELQKEVARKRIAIECNPTSNYYIGNVNKYESHPIVTFNNRKLTNDSELLKNNPQINVSINTDDQGIFDTSLRNEYALMALALIKAKDEEGNKMFDDDCIYEWLDEIRKNSLNQSFI